VVHGSGTVNTTGEEMEQCLRWVTDAYQEFLTHGVLSPELVNHLQVLYDKLRTGSITDGSGAKTVPDLTMIDSSGMQGSKPQLSANAVPAVGAADLNQLPAAVADRHHQRSRSRSIEKPIALTSIAAVGGSLLGEKSHAQSPDSRASSGLANSITMEFGSDNGEDPYSPFDSPFSMSGAKRPVATSHDGRMSELGHTQGDFVKERGGSAGVPDFGSAGVPPSPVERSVKRPPPPPPVLSPQDIIAGRIADEIALLEVLVRIQFELASIGDLPAEDDATSEMVDTGEPSTQPVVPASEHSPPVTTTASTDPTSLLGNSSGLPALPSPDSLQEMIGQSATPSSTTRQSPAVTTIPATAPQTTVSLGQADAFKGRLPYTPPIVSTSSPSIATTDSITAGPAAAVKSTTVEDPAASSTSTITNSQPASSEQTKTSTSSQRQKPKTSTASTKSDSGNKSASKDSTEKVFRRLLYHLYVLSVWFIHFH